MRIASMSILALCSLFYFWEVFWASLHQLHNNNTYLDLEGVSQPCMYPQWYFACLPWTLVFHQARLFLTNLH